MHNWKFIALFFIFVYVNVQAQHITQNIKGTITDSQSGISLPGASVIILGTDPVFGTTTNIEGRFIIENVPVGRYDIQVTFIGYKPFIAKEIMLNSGKETVLNISMTESVEMLQQVEINANSNKNEPLNTMATVSARQVNMEEANRYAGGFDDPSRLVASYAGVSSGIENNAIVIRGNSPKGILWQMEGIAIPNPNHFGDYVSLGGGGLTALSSQTMASSDFFTGAFPAEYGNALSGVFDIGIRTGNTDEREYTFQAGLTGLDVAAEGPFKKGASASYLFNYRYSTLGLIAPILPDEMGILTYQDLSYKLNFPTKAGTFSFWGLGALDYQRSKAQDDSSKWENSDDNYDMNARLSMGAAGIKYKKVIGTKTYVQASLAATQNGINYTQSEYNNLMVLEPQQDVQDYRWKYTFSTFVNHKFSARHTNKSGFVYDWFWYNTRIQNRENTGAPLQTYADDKGNTTLLQAFSQSKISLRDNFIINAGLRAQYFLLNNNFSLEPRIGTRWNFLPRHTLSLAYGLHSQAERIQFYLVRQETPAGTVMPNKNLDFNKSHHLVLGYEYMIDENLVLKIEPYVQFLYDIPVVPGSYISTINLDELWDFNDSLVNEGNGRNLGIDLTLEKYLSKGYYYLFTASLFDSKYTGGDGIERNTRYNKGYVINALAGKEWKLGKDNQNLFGANLRFTYMGGDYIIPVDEAQTIDQGMIIEDYEHAWEEKLSDAPILSLSLNYRINKARHSSQWSLQIINVLGYKEYTGYSYDAAAQSIQKTADRLIIPNISYKIEF
jgi:hypothetical protein